MTDDPKDRARKMKHDLRAAIGQILGYSEMLHEEAEDGGLSSMVSDLERIERAAKQALNLVDQAFDPGAPESETKTEEIVIAPQAAAPAEAPEEVDGQTTTGSGGRLLVTDDSEANRDVIARRLKAMGFDVTTAPDGPTCLRSLAEEKFDIVLLDLMMPGMSGMEVLEAIRKTHSPSELPVIMATALDESQMIVGALRAGANDYVTKPLDFPVVLARIKTQLSLKRANDAIQDLATELEVRNRFIRDTFGRYLSDEIVESLLESPEGLELGGKKQKVTIMMTDIRGFTTLAERMPPDQLMRMLNNYLGAMVEIVQKYGGTVDEFIGDAILAIFGAPIQRDDDTTRAVACAIAMQLAMDSVNEFNKREGFPEIEMGIALHTGEVVVGNIGSEARAKYGVVGTNVNLTSRIESYTVGGQVLISEATLEDAGPILSIAKEIEIAAKGFKDPVKVYDLRGIGGLYGLFLTEKEDELFPLTRRLRARCAIVDGEGVGTTFDGEFVKMSETAGEMRSSADVGTHAELRIRIDGIDELYGKVLRHSDGAMFVRFTSVPPGFNELLGRSL